jgi:hypothetical protein
MIRCRFSGSRKLSCVAVVVALCCAMFPISSFGAAEGFTPANASGSKALLFTFSGLQNLGAAAFNGGVGGKYFLAENMAVRGNLQFTTSSQSIPYSGTGSGTDGSLSGTQFGIGGALEYFLAKARLCPFVGGGFGIALASTTKKDQAPSGATQVTTENAPQTINGITYSPGFGFNINGLAGAEFFITQEISLAV